MISLNEYIKIKNELKNVCYFDCSIEKKSEPIRKSGKSKSLFEL